MNPALLGLLPTMIDNAFGAIKRFLPADPEAQAKAKNELEMSLNSMDLDVFKTVQDVNKVEAGHSSMFVAGWRPFIGWVCGCSLATVVLIAMVQWLISGVQPVLSFVWAILGSLLGLGGLRSLEKKWGVPLTVIMKKGKGAIVNGEWVPYGE